MKFKKLAKVIDHKFIRVTVKMSDRWVKICDSTTGLSNDFIKTYGEYEVDSIEVSLKDTYNKAPKVLLENYEVMNVNGNFMPFGVEVEDEY